MATMTQGQSKTGECEVCPKKDVTITNHRGIWYCDDCWKAECAAVSELTPVPVESIKTPEQEQFNNAIATYQNAYLAAKEIGPTVAVRTDLFNAATVAIVNVKAAIDNDASITNKPYALAEALLKQFNEHKVAIFELNEQVIDRGNKQKAIQVYLNNLANTLRAEEREKLKLSDISYVPKPVKPIVVKDKVVTRKPKIDKTELRNTAAKLGISEFMLQQIIVAKNVTIQEAADIIRKSIEAAQKAGQ